MLQNIEETEQFILDFKKRNSSKIATSKLNNLLPVVVQDEMSKEVLLLAYINQEALNQSLEAKILTLWSSSVNLYSIQKKFRGYFFSILALLKK